MDLFEEIRRDHERGEGIKALARKYKVHRRMVREALRSGLPSERKKPDLLNASRKKRIAAGSGTSVEDINKLFKQFMEMGRMVKQVSKLGQKGLARAGMASLFRR